MKFFRHDIKNRLRNRLTELSLSNLKLSLNLPKKLTDSDLEEIVDVWNRFRPSSHYICILSLMHFVKHLSASIMNFNSTISKGGQSSKGDSPLNETLEVMLQVMNLVLRSESCIR